MPRKKNKNKNPVCPQPISKDSCKYCHKSNLKLLKCSRCKEVFYCSVNCQKMDWVNHKTACKPKTREQQQSDPPLSDEADRPLPLICLEKKVPSSSARIQQTSKDSCKYCHKSNLKLLKCSRCKEVFYCSVDCQKMDWVNHKTACKPKTREQQQPPDPPLSDEGENCNHCGKSDVKLRICSQCHDVKYCSRKCQKAEWPKHKVECKKKQTKCIKCFGICKEDSYYCTRCLFNKHIENLLPFFSISKYEFIAQRRFPEFEVITDFDDIKQLPPIFDFLPNMQVLVVQMYRCGYHIFRPSMFLSDATGRCLHLIFYLDLIDQVIFPWEKFQPGNYICILFPRLHLFIDGTIGFRIESLQRVSFIEAF